MTPIIGVALLIAGAGIVLMVLLSSANDTSVFDAEVGDCFVLGLAGDDVAVDTIDVLECTDPHDAQIVATGTLNAAGDREYPGDEQLFGEIDRLCPAWDTYDGYLVVPLAPNEASWIGQDGAYACIAVTADGSMVSDTLL